MGAWTQMYRKGMKPKQTDPAGYAISAIKYELDFNGYGQGLNFGPEFGATCDENVRHFQMDENLQVDGVVGPVTAKKLLERRIGMLENNYGIPHDLMCKAVTLESACDFGAVGVVDPMDHGLVQINAGFHPEITIQQAFLPSFALDYYARSVAGVHQKLNDWDGAIAAWNAGAGGADVWVGFHKPAHGGPNWFPDLFERATKYVQLVKDQTC